jgi:hypothetical protein
MAIEQIGITTEYKADGLGETKPVLRIGGKTEKFVPNVNISFALESSKEQYFLNINRASVTVDKEVSSLASEKLALTIGNETDIWHINEKGEFEWDIEFAQKPATNKFSWALTHTEGLEFAYQPALTQAEIDKGRIRPDNVVGSYAVYCNKSGRYKSSDGKTIVNYGPGKLLHIYRPLCTDAKGNQTWAELLIEKGTLAITIPQKYLDTAVYPVTLDPTFGYTSNGASSDYTGNNYIYYMGLDDLAPAGTLNSISCYGTVSSSSANNQYGIYTGTTGSTKTARDRDASSWTRATALGWYTNPVDMNFTLVEGTQYWAAWWCSGTLTVRYDSGGSKAMDYGYYESGLPATDASEGFLTNVHNSAYATYTAAGGASSTPSSTPFLKPFRQAFGRGGF